VKAVIVDIQAKNAVALNKNGQFIKLKSNRNMKIGTEIDIPERAGLNIYSFTRMASAAAMFFVVMGLGYGVYSYNSPFSYIDMDINPSVEITANRYNRIIDIEALNDDGNKLINKESFKNKSLKEGLEGLLQNAIEEGYIKDNLDNAVMLTVSSKNEVKAAEVENSIKITAEEGLKKVDKVANLVVEKVSIQRHEDARRIDISPGKLLLIERLQEVDSAIKLEDYKNAPVRDILKKINDYNKENNYNKGKDKSVANLSGDDEKGKKGNDQNTIETTKSNDNDRNDNNGVSSGGKLKKNDEAVNSPELNKRYDKQSDNDNKEIKDSKGKNQTSIIEKIESQMNRNQNKKKENSSETKKTKD
jgi:hypothetical protein